MNFVINMIPSIKRLSKRYGYILIHNMKEYDIFDKITIELYKSLNCAKILAYAYMLRYSIEIEFVIPIIIYEMYNEHNISYIDELYSKYMNDREWFCDFKHKWFEYLANDQIDRKTKFSLEDLRSECVERLTELQNCDINVFDNDNHDIIETITDLINENQVVYEYIHEVITIILKHLEIDRYELKYLENFINEFVQYIHELIRENTKGNKIELYDQMITKLDDLEYSLRENYSQMNKLDNKHEESTYTRGGEL